MIKLWIWNIELFTRCNCYFPVHTDRPIFFPIPINKWVVCNIQGGDTLLRFLFRFSFRWKLHWVLYPFLSDIRPDIGYKKIGQSVWTGRKLKSSLGATVTSLTHTSGGFRISQRRGHQPMSGMPTYFILPPAWKKFWPGGEGARDA